MNGEPQIHFVEAVVAALLPEYRQVRVGDAEGRH